MKIKEREYKGGGLSGGGWYYRIRLLKKDETKPEGAEEVAADVPECDWTMEA